MVNGIYISRNRNDFKIEQIEKLIHQSDWAAKRTVEEIKKSVGNSTCYGVFNERNEMVGFARIITDFTTTFYLMDVIIDEAYRGRGLGHLLMDEIMNDVGHLYGVLHTDSASQFYEPYGFKITATSESGESIMEKAKNLNMEESGRR